MLLLLGNALAVFLDFSVGTFIVLTIGYFLNYSPGLHEYFLGGIFGLMPDFDVLFMLLYRGKVYGDHHQYITHRPLIIIPFIAVIIILVGNLFWTIVAPACVFWHYIHDTEEFGGGGIAWLWPFSKKYLSPLKGAIDPKKSLMGQNQGKHKEWLNATWLKPSKTSLVELILGSFLFGTVVKINLDWQLSAATIIFLWLCVICAWLTEKHKP